MGLPRGLQWSLPAALGLAIVAIIALPPVAGAHAFLVRTTPRAGERLGMSPQVVRLRFSEPVAGGEQVAVRLAGGEAIPVTTPRLRQGGAVVEAPLPPLGDGVYIVSWQVLSQDGELSVGEFAFAVGAAGQVPAVARQGTSAIDWPGALARWIFLAGLLLAVGGLVSERWIWAPVGRRYALVIPPLPVGRLLLLALVGGLLQFLLLAWQSGGPSNRPTDWPRWPWLAPLTTRPGLLAFAQVALVAYGAWLFPVSRARPLLLAPLGLAIAIAAARGHAGAGAGAPWWAVPANVLHLGAVALWSGGLAHLVVVLWRMGGKDAWPALGEGARRYAGFALGLVAVALPSGAVVALALFSDPAELIAIGYGRVLLVKLLAVAVALGLALAARRRLRKTSHGGRACLPKRLARAEGLLVLLAVAVAATLASSTPPRNTLAGENLLGAPSLTGPVLRQAARVGWLSVYVAAASDQLQVQVLTPQGEPATDARVAINGRAPDGTDLEVFSRACGPGCVTTAFPWQAGTTALAVAASSREWGGGTAQFAVSWPLQVEDPALLQRVVATMRSLPRFTITESITASPGSTFSSTYPITGEQFMSSEPYVGGAEDVRPVPAPAGARALVLYISGSSYWFYLEIDDAGRLRRETAVTPGNLVERTFVYDTGTVAPAPGAPREDTRGGERIR